ncbi:MAG: cobalamin-dependent protein, partial [Pelovirga sp.]
MKILLISTNRNNLPVPVMPIGACIVAQAAEQAGHTVFVLDLMFSNDPAADIQATLARRQPDAVAVSVRNIDNVDMRNPLFFLDGLQSIVQEVRNTTGVPIILGGAALGIMPEQILRLVPECIAVIGDGELVFPQLLDRISHREDFADLPGIAWIEQGAFRLNSPLSAGFSTICPAPDYKRWLDIPSYRARMATVPIQTKTGCQYNCVYCTYPKIEGSSCRLKDPASIVAAILGFATAGLRDIEIVDSVFNAPLEHAMAICSARRRAQQGAPTALDLTGLATNPVYLGSFLVYFLLGYLLYAALLAALGSVCNTLKEAQTLAIPVQGVLFVPLLAMIPIGRDPSGTLAQVLTWIPPFTPFVMMNRAAQPPETWVYVATTVLLLVSIAGMTWLGAKVFRIGILMT